MFFGIYPLAGQPVWPARYKASFGFEAVRDHDSKVIVFRIDSLSDAYLKGIRPGMEIIGWNTLPVERYLKKIKVGKTSKSFPGIGSEELRIMLLTRGRPGETAEVFFMTGTGNNWGIRIVTRDT
ncbi:MAG: hypothetical protein V2A67_01630 [Bacteroidota bacterium]